VVGPSTPFVLSMWLDKLTTIVNIPFALSLSKGKRYVVLRTGLSSHMLSAGGILAQLIYAQTIRVGSVCRSLFKNILSL